MVVKLPELSDPKRAGHYEYFQDVIFFQEE